MTPLQEKAKTIVTELYKLGYAYMPGGAGHTDNVHRKLYGNKPEAVESEALYSAVCEIVAADSAGRDALEEFVREVES
jgi:hypothetical protein